MSKKLVEVKALRDGICTPRISNSVKGKKYVTTEYEADALSKGDNPSIKVIGPYVDKAAVARQKAEDKAKAEAAKTQN